MDSITKLCGISLWAFVQDNKFQGQGADFDKLFVFKMSEVGPGSGIDLVKRMQPDKDLENAWMMFDHVKRVRQWTTMACHVYDSTYCRVMIIASCDMQSEDYDAQIVFWKNLNVVMERNDIVKPNFKGFMADIAYANWNAVRSYMATVKRRTAWTIGREPVNFIGPSLWLSIPRSTFPKNSGSITRRCATNIGPRGPWTKRTICTTDYVHSGYPPGH